MAVCCIVPSTNNEFNIFIFFFSTQCLHAVYCECHCCTKYNTDYNRRESGKLGYLKAISLSSRSI
jgi:hypothetical protein